MDKTETPIGDSKTGEANAVVADRSTSGKTAPTPVTKSGASGKGMKTSIGERVLIGIIVLVVIAVVIFGTVFTLVRESRRRNNNDQPYDPYDVDYGDPVTESPFEVEASLFTSNETKPYASIEELRKDIEALAKTFANGVILEEANRFQGSDDSQYLFAEEGDVMLDAAPASSGFVMKDGPDSAKGSSEVFEGVDDFETYQHEAGVVKNDLVKSNGAHVFVANDNRINVWDLKGNLFETTRIGKKSSVHITAMLMSPGGDKLVVIASDYDLNIEYKSIIYSQRETLVTIFDIDGGTLTEISQTNIDGNHVESYSVGDNVHIVTRMGLNKWAIFDDNLYRFTFDEYLSDEEYVAEATQRAEEIIPDFVDEFIDLVTEGNNIILSRLVGFPNFLNDYQSITQIYSFDISKTGDEDGMEFNASKSLVLTPGNTGNVYATNEWIWVVDTNVAWHLEQQDYLQQTMILGFRLEGASSNFAALGTFPGEILSPFSIDFKKEDGREYVRIAVTQDFFQNNFWQPRPMPMQEEWESDPGDGVFEEIEEESRTLNEVIIFEIPKAGDSQEVNELVKLGSVEVGKKHERITAVRFFDNISYVVTFERTDPFYVLNLSDPTNPEILGELKVPGFSEFMHPINDDNSMLLTVGQDADENGFVTGFQISIFDSTIPNDPKLVSRLVIEQASSNASWDERSFRYVQVDDVGRLIIPLYSYSSDRFGNFENSFNGFTVFGVDLNRTDMITREIDIDHSQITEIDSYSWQDSQCYCFLPQRSLLFDGNLMTMKASTVISTNLVSEEIQWSLSLQGTNCCYGY